MIQVLTILTNLFGLLAATSALLLGLSLAELEEKYPIFKILEGKKVYLLVFTITCLVISYVAKTWKDIIFSKKPKLEQIQGPHGEFIQKATAIGFEKELNEGTVELKSEARDFFNAAEHDFAASRYRQAANNYLKSIDVIPTMSAYLNRGISLRNISTFAQAEDTFISGLQMALKKQDKGLEGAFRGNIGNVYFNQGKYEDALKYHQDALTTFQEIDNPLGQANALGNIGLVYANQGKLEEALKSCQAALDIHIEIGNPLGQASDLSNIGLVSFNQGKYEDALNSYQDALTTFQEIDNPLGQAHALVNIGLVYANQGKLEEALKSYQAALDIHIEIGNPLGQASDLGNIGNVYSEQGKLEEALKLLMEARVIYFEVGATRQLQQAEQLIERLKSP